MYLQELLEQRQELLAFAEAHPEHDAAISYAIEDLDQELHAAAGAAIAAYDELVEFGSANPEYDGAVGEQLDELSEIFDEWGDLLC